MSEEHCAEARGVVKWLIAIGAVVVGILIELGVKRWSGRGSRIKAVEDLMAGAAAIIVVFSVEQNCPYCLIG